MPQEFILDVPPGINSDDTTFSAKGRWADGNNVRFWAGKAQVIGGWNRDFAGSATFVESNIAFYGPCRSMFAWTDNTGGARIAYANQRYVRVQIPGGNVATLYDITPASYSSGYLNSQPGACFASFGQNLLIARWSGSLYQWALDTAVPATILTGTSGCPGEIRGGIVVTPERQVLAFGCHQVSGGFNPRCIRGSDLESASDWTPTSANNAFEHVLDGDAGSIMGARQVGSYVAVWTTTSLYLGQFIGNPGQTYRFDRVEGNCGLMARDAVAVVDGIAYWMGTDRLFRVWSPGSPPKVMDCPIQRDFADNMVVDVYYTRNAYAVVVPGRNEIWWFYPDARDGTNECTRYVALAIGTGHWFRGQLARTAMVSNSALINFPGLSNVLPTVPRTDVYGVDSSGVIYAHEVGNTAAGSAMSWHIQTADQYLDTGRNSLMVQGCEPDFEDQTGDVNLTLYVKQRAQSTATTKGPYPLADGATKKDFRASGKLVSVKFSGGSASGSYARFGKPKFHFVVTGGR